MIVDIHKQALYASLVEITQMKVVLSYMACLAILPSDYCARTYWTNCYLCLCSNCIDKNDDLI